jgi:putative transposase
MALYHVWFGTKRRKWLLQGEVTEAANKLMAQIAHEKGIKLLECQAIVDHMHLLVEVETKEDLAKAMNLLKGVSARRLFQQFPELKLDAGVANFWQHRYGSKIIPASAPLNQSAITSKPNGIDWKNTTDRRIIAMAQPSRLGYLLPSNFA